MSATTVMIVEDDPAFLQRFCGIVVRDPDLALFAAVSDLASARQALQKSAPDVLLTDIGLPDGSGIELIRETAVRYPETDIMVVTVFGDEGHVIASVEAGATGYVLKDSDDQEFTGLIKQLVDGGSPISPLIARQLLRRFRAPVVAAAPAGAGAASRPGPVPDAGGLSARESEVLGLLVKGFSFAEIAQLLAVSPHTITAHVKKIYQKLAVHSRAEAAYEASRLGLFGDR